MGADTKIEWTDSSWTPIRARNKATGKVGWHCTHATPGCEHCYSETLNKRLGTGLPFKPGHEKDIELFLDEKLLTDPLRWRRSRRVFVCSMTDLFADFVPDAWIDRVFAVMALAPQHQFQVLTKRSKRMRIYMNQHRDWADDLGGAAYSLVDDDASCAVTNWINGWSRWRHMPDDGNPLDGTRPRWPLPNVWLGVSAEDQPRYDERKDDLRATPAAVRFFSLEPLLGPVIGDWFGDWVVVGGESGKGARLMEAGWARSIRDQCAETGVQFFMKQMTKRAPIPDDLMIREFPDAR